MSRALLVGRFQPPHRGHVHAIRAAARRHDALLVAIGSSQHGHERPNPLTVGERFELLSAALDEAGVRNVHVCALPDVHRHASWVAHVETLLPAFDTIVTHNPLTRRLFTRAGYRVEPADLWKPEACAGRRIRVAWARGEDPSSLLSPAVLRGVEKFRLPERVRRLAREGYRDRSARA